LQEARYNIPNSLDFLKDYEPDTPAMKKAKTFLSKMDKYNANPEAREAMHQQYKPEIDALRARVWKVHIVLAAEEGLRIAYNSRQHEPVPLQQFFIQQTSTAFN
jgi:hypothetical protein